MRACLFASTNPGKILEVQAVATVCGLEIIGPDKLQADLGSPPEINENGKTYLENAVLKAEGFLSWSGQPSLADDSGLEVQALAGAPGLHTARYAGENCTAADNRRKLLSVMQGIRDRRARFVCVLYLLFPDRAPFTAEAELRGEISTEERGAGGFGYDSIFVVDGFGGKTLAEMKEQGVAVKTHRELALEKLLTRLNEEVDPLRHGLSPVPPPREGEDTFCSPSRGAVTRKRD